MPTLRRLAFTLALVAALLAPTPAQAAPDPSTCTGYPEARVFLEAQDWWQPPGTENFGHVHLGACWPRVGEHVTGTVHLDFKVQLHDNPGVLQNVRVHLLDGNGVNHQVLSVPINQTAAQHCPATPDQCVWMVPIDLPTTVSGTDGYQNIRPAAIVMHPEHGGTKRFAGAAWPMYLANGNPVKDSISPTRIAGSSWYTGALYEEAELDSPLPATVSGVWTPTVRLDKGAGGIDVTSAFASLDPAFHAVPAYPGTVLLDRAGPYRGLLRIDTTALTNGEHKLFLRAGAPCDGSAGNNCGLKPDGSSNNVSTHYSAQTFSFTVAN